MTVHSGHNDFIQKAISIVESQLHNERFGVSELARELGMSRSNLHRKIRAAQKGSTSFFICAIRLNHALELLKNSELTASEIAYNVGFGSVSYFNKCFKRHYGYAPGDVRRKGSGSTDSATRTREEPAGHLMEDKKRNLLASGMPDKPITSIAVLPFENISPEPSQEYFSDGLTDEIINALTHIQSLKVIARTSAFAFKGRYEDVRIIGKELDVDALLEGSVRKDGNRLRITAQLIRVSDGSHLWSERYDREMKDVFEIQDEISLSIADKLKVELPTEEKEQILKTHTRDLEAYNHYLKGLQYWYNNRTWEGLQKAMKCFQQAVDSDPDYAQAYTGLANTFIVLIDWGYLHPKETMPRIRELVSRSMELEDMHADTYISLGFSQAFYDLGWEEADHTTSKALQLNQNSAVVHHFYSLYQMTLGKFKYALEHNMRARELDPLSAIFCFARGLILYMAGQFDNSLEQYRKTVSLEHGFILAYFWSLFPLIQMDRIEEAADLYRKYLLANPETEEYAEAPGNAFKNGGKEGFLRWIIDKGLSFDKGVFNHPYWKAIFYAHLGQSDEALEQLDLIMELKSPRMAYIMVDPAFNNIRSDPRFSEIIRRVGSVPG